MSLDPLSLALGAAAGLAFRALWAAGTPCRDRDPLSGRTCQLSPGHEGVHVSRGGGTYLWGMPPGPPPTTRALAPIPARAPYPSSRRRRCACDREAT